VDVMNLSSDLTRTTATRSSIKRVLAIAIGPLLFAAMIWLAWFWWTEGRFIETTDDAYVGGDVTTLSSKIAGFIEKVSVIDNQSVEAGDLLVKLDDRDYRAQLVRAGERRCSDRGYGQSRCEPTLAAIDDRSSRGGHCRDSGGVGAREIRFRPLPNAE
jgi:multidrug efflux pump subunit AcrA (membrane-fusion protein)